MMRNKLYLLLAILSVFVICLATAEETARKTDKVKNSRKTTVAEDKYDGYNEDKYEHEDHDDDEIDDSFAPKSSYAHNRFVSYDPTESTSRGRSRWPSTSAPGLSLSLPTLPFTIGQFPDEEEWDSAGYGSAFSSPLQTPSYGAQRMSPNGQTCSSLIDPQYPIFSDTCGAVPQARYSLPNAFGHRDKWQVAQLLNVLASSEVDPTCTRSTRLLLCPILFPSCPTRHQPAPVLPCQAYCRAVKARCSTPLLESLPCEILPHTSDFCPMNQGYGPMAPARNFPLNMQSPSPMMPGGHPSSRQLSALQTLLSSPAFQAALSGQGYQGGFAPQNLQAGFGAQAFPSPFLGQHFQPAAAPAPAPAPTPVPVATPPPPPAVPAAVPMNHYNNGQFPMDTISAMLGELPSRSYSNDYRQNTRYLPATRSSSETRPTNYFRGSSNSRSSGSSSMVRA